MPDLSNYSNLGAGADTGSAAPLSKLDHPANTAKSKLEVALYWASRGFQVFRLGENRKTPLADTNGHDDATTDEATIRAWWTGPLGEDLNYNVGLRASVCPVVDLDVKDGRDGVGNYLSLGGEVDGLVVRTATGGYHVYVDGPDLKGKAGDVGPGIDTRGSGGYVVAAGSVIDGVPYEVVSDKPRLACPQFVIDAVGVRGEHAGNTKTRYAIEDDRPRSIAEGIAFAQRHEPATSGRWHELGFKAGCELCRLGVSLPTALDILRDHWIPRGSGFKSHEQFCRDVAGGYEDARQKGEHGSKSSEAHLLGLKDVPVEMPPEEPAQHEQASPEDGFYGFSVKTLKQCAESCRTPREHLIANWIAYGNVALFVAPPGAGKSAMAPLMGHAVAQGRPIFGHKTKQGRVLYIAAEATENMEARAAALLQAHGDTDNFLVVGGVTNLLKDQDEVERLTRLVADYVPALTFIDTLACGFSGIDILESKDMNYVADLARSLIPWRGDKPLGAVVIIHHTPKNNPATAKGDDSLNAKVDFTSWMYRDPKTKVTTGHVTKNRNGPSDEDAYAFRIDERVTGRTEEGTNITSALAVEVNLKSLKRAPKLRPADEVALRVFRDLEQMEQDGNRMEGVIDGIDFDAMGPRVDLDAWKAACVAARLTNSPVKKNQAQAFRRAVSNLQAAGLVRVWNTFAFAPLAEAQAPMDSTFSVVDAF